MVSIRNFIARPLDRLNQRLEELDSLLTVFLSGVSSLA